MASARCSRTCLRHDAEHRVRREQIAQDVAEDDRRRRIEDLGRQVLGSVDPSEMVKFTDNVDKLMQSLEAMMKM